MTKPSHNAPQTLQDGPGRYGAPPTTYATVLLSTRSRAAKRGDAALMLQSGRVKAVEIWPERYRNPLGFVGLFVEAAQPGSTGKVIGYDPWSGQWPKLEP